MKIVKEFIWTASIVEVSAAWDKFHFPDDFEETLHHILLQELAANICYQRGGKLIPSFRTFMPIFQIENVFGKLGPEGGIEVAFISALWPPSPNLTCQVRNS